MGFFDRIWRVIRANLNALVSKAEDPEKILEQVVLDMQDDLIQLRQAVAQAIATQKRTERQYSQAQTTANDWYQRAQLALQKGADELAREALVRRKSYDETATAMQAQLTQQAVVVDQLKQNMKKLESKISEAKSKKDLYIARARSAKATQQINEMMGNVGMGNVGTGSAIQAFDRMEEKVLQLEAQSEAITELSMDDLEQRFEKLGQADDIDAELEAMKSQALSGTGSTAQLPASQPAADPELEKLRQQIREG